MKAAALLAAMMLQTPLPAPATSGESRRVDACLSADLTAEDAPEDLYVLDRRFPDGRKTRDLAWRPEPNSAPAAVVPGPVLQMIYGVEGTAAGPLKQLSIADTVVFERGQTATSGSFELLLEGVSLGRVPWPEYETAARSYAASGSPRFVSTEIWLIWDGQGEALRRVLEEIPQALTVRLVDQAGRTVKSALYELSETPLTDKAAVARLIKGVGEASCGPLPR